MSYLRCLSVFLVAITFLSCGHPEGSITRATSAITAQDVVDAWDLHCATWNFDPCPPNVLSGLCTDTMGDMYNGANFTLDCDGLMLAMQVELDHGGIPDPGDGVGLNAVIVDDIWFQ